MVKNGRSYNSIWVNCPQCQLETNVCIDVAHHNLKPGILANEIVFECSECRYLAKVTATYEVD